MDHRAFQGLFSSSGLGEGASRQVQEYRRREAALRRRIGGARRTQGTCLGSCFLIRLDDSFCFWLPYLVLIKNFELLLPRGSRTEHIMPLFLVPYLRDPKGGPQNGPQHMMILLILGNVHRGP